MKEETDRILDKVRKLMRLANDAAAAQGERDNAIRMAHGLLAKHNLTMAQAEARGERAEEQRVTGSLEGRNHPWARKVAIGVARLFFCKHFYISLPGSHIIHYFVGKESNVITASEMTSYVVRSIDREARRATGGGGSDWRAFCKAAAHAVAVRCEEIRAEAERPVAATASSSTAIVLASVYAQEEEANRKLIEAEVGKLRTAGDRQKDSGADWAKRAGSSYGKTISLQNQLGGKKDPLVGDRVKIINRRDGSVVARGMLLAHYDDVAVVDCGAETLRVPRSDVELDTDPETARLTGSR